MRNAVEELEGLEEIPVTEKTTSIVYRAAYDSIRSAVQAFMSLNGYTPYSHEAIVAYGIENDLLSAGEANRLDRARRFRNDISYRGESASVDQTTKLKNLAGEIVPRLERELEKRNDKNGDTNRPG